MDQRVAFDFEAEFTNGGGLQGQDFRLDVLGPDVTDEDRRCVVRDLRLLMVAGVWIRNRRLIEERTSAGLGSAAAAATPVAERRFVDLSHPDRRGDDDHPGLPVPRSTRS